MLGYYGLIQKFKAYNLVHKNQKDIPPRKIQNIYEDKFGNLWIKTIDHKLYIFDKKREFFNLLSSQLSQKFSVNSQIIKVMPTENGDFLLLTKDKDLLLATPTENADASINLLFRSDVKTAGSKLMHSIFSESSDYLIWIGSNFSLISCLKGNKFVPKTVDYYLKKISKIPHSFFTSAFKQNNILWLGDKEGNILKINFKSGNIDIFDKFRGDGEVQNIMVDKFHLYVSIKEKGIFCWNLESNAVSSIVNSPTDIVQSFGDSEGIIWFVTSGKGVIAYDKKKSVARTFDFPGNDYVNENISWQDGEKLGMFFLSRTGEVMKIDRQTMTSLCLSDQIKGAQAIKKISSILFDENGILWLTSYDDGVFRMSFPQQQFNLLNIVGMKIQETSAIQSGGINPTFRNTSHTFC